MPTAKSPKHPTIEATWSAAVRVRLSESDVPTFHPAIIERVLPLLDGRAPVVSQSSSELSLAFGVRGASYLDARAEADLVVKDLLRELGLDPPTIVDYRVMSNAEINAEIEALPTCVGVGEAAQILGVSKQRVAQLAQKAEFPQPAFKLRATPVWRDADIRRFVARRNALQAR